MAPQTSIPVSASVLGTIGTMCAPSMIPDNELMDRQILVHPTRSSSMAQPPNEKHRRSSGAHDVSMVTERRPLRRVRDRTEFQYPDPDPATMFLLFVPGQLGTVFEIWTVAVSFSLEIQQCSRNICNFFQAPAILFSLPCSWRSIQLTKSAQW